MDSVVVVGASLAGLRAAETLREEGFDGTLTVVGDESHRPYDRPPLSKQVLAGAWDADQIRLPAAGDDGLDLTWRLGQAASGLDLADRSVGLADGHRVSFDGLVIACGARALVPPIPGVELEGVVTLRTLDDCLGLRAALDSDPAHVVIVGAGFIGVEVAATCRGRDVDVTVVEALTAPLERSLGPTIGAVVADLHRDHGVDLRLGTGVDAFEGDERVETVRLADGTSIDADVVVVGVGVRPNTEWLEGSGLTLDDGVVCDETCLAAPGVVAAGDVARWPNPRFAEVMRVEHWENALGQGAHAARRLLAGAPPSPAIEPYAPVPWFWSDQYDRKIQLAGRAAATDDVEVVDGSLAERRFVALYGRAGMLVGALGMNRPAPVARWRAAIAEGTSWNDALAAARG